MSSSLTVFRHDCSQPKTTVSTASQSPQFLLLLRQPPGGKPEPAELQAIMTKFKVWMEGLYARGAVAGTNGLDPTAGVVLRGPGGAELTDGPFAEAKEFVGGYILINAPDLVAADEIARACPGLHYGLSVEVRPVESRPAN